MKSLGLFLACLASATTLTSLAAIEGATKACTPGTWTTSIDNARKVGVANKRFIAIAWGKSEGCGFCNSAADNVFNLAEFKQWSKDNNIPILWVDDLDAGSCSEWIWNKYYGGKAVTFAQFLVIDPSNNDNLLLKALFQGSTVQYGTTSKTVSKVTDCPNAWLMSPFNPKQTIGLVDWTLRGLNNSAAAALSVVPDAQGVASPSVNRLWNSYGTRSLSCVNLWSSSSVLPKIALITRAEDQFDWFKFDAKSAGAYEVKLEDYVDSHNEGQLYVFKDAATAKAVTTYAEAAAKAMEKGSCPMSTIAEKGGWKFAVPAAGTYYLLFTRPDSEQCKQLSTKGVEYDGYVEKTLEYNFTLQETELEPDAAFSFPSATERYLVSEDAGTLKVPVVRTVGSGDAETTVSVTAASALPEGCIAAKEGVDFTIANKKVVFHGNEKTNYVDVAILRGTVGIEVPTRVFALMVESPVEPKEGLPSVNVAILDADGEDEPEGNILLSATTGWKTDIYRLNGEDIADAFVLTNLTASAGSVYAVDIAPVLMNDFKNGKMFASLMRYDPVKNDYALIGSRQEFGADGKATFVYGSNTSDGWATEMYPDVILAVGRDAAASGEYPTVRYALRWRRYDRPVVAFECGAAIEVSHDAPVATANMTVKAAGFAALCQDLADNRFPALTMDICWQTVDGTEPAVPGEDYEPVADGRMSFASGETASLAVSLLYPDRLSYPERSFGVKLLADTNPTNLLYVLGGSVCRSVKFLADGVLPAAPTVIDLANAGWQSTGEEVRNLNYTNVADWVTVTNVQNGSFYRLKAEDVLSRPADTETDVFVDVYTNGALSAYSFRLADLILTDDAQAPVLMFEGLTNETVQLKVSRTQDEQVRLEYRLAMREEQYAGLDPADEYDDTKAGAAAYPIAIDPTGVETNLVRLLNGSTVAAYGVNDTNDWFRFSGIVPGETYCFAAKDVATNVPVRVVFYHGEEDEPFASLSLAELTQDGYRYDAAAMDDVMVRICREPSEDYALVKYTLGASKYIWPVVGFTTAEIVVTNAFTNAQLRTESTVVLEAYRHFNTNRVVAAAVSAACTVSGWGNDDYLAGVYPTDLEFQAAEAVTNEVTLGINTMQGAWVGDWTFNVVLNVDTNWVRYGEITNVFVKVIDQKVPAKDPTDGPEGDDFRDGATSLDLSVGSVVSTNHLNGIDVEHEGVLSTDTDDWFKLAGLVPENTYRISIPSGQYVDKNTEGLGLTATIESVTIEKTVTFLSLRNGQYLDIPYAGEGDVYIKMSRTTCGEEKPVSVAYALKVERIDWPKFNIAAERSTVRNDAGIAKAVVTRSDNLDQADTVVVKVVDTNAVKVVTDPSFETNVVFAVGETRQTVAVGLVPSESGYWKRGGDFSLVLESADEHPYVTLGETNAVVTVTDASGIPENDYPEDDVETGAQAYLVDVVEKTATGHLAPGQSVAWLNGSDTVDWYRLTGAKAGNRYRISITSFGSINAEKYPTTIMIASEGVTRTTEVIGKNNVWSWDYVPESDGDIMVKIARAQDDEAKDVSVKYLLTFRQLASAYVRFQTSEQTVSGAASFVYVDVECAVDAGEVLFEDAVINVLPTENAETNNAAAAGVGFDARPITLTWAEGSTGGVQRIAVPIGGSSETWKGDETFLLVLTNETDSAEIAAPENGGEMCVTVTDIATPVYGSVGVAEVGVNDGTMVPATSVSPFSVREGDSVLVRVVRTGGQAGWVEGVFKWTYGTTQIGETVKARLFDGVTVHESTDVEVPLIVPVSVGYQAERVLTLNFSIETAKAKTVTVTKGTPAALKFAVEDMDYKAPLSAYSADDPENVAFRTGGSSWFLDRDGGIRAALAVNATQTTTATVTGSGTLHFDAEVSGGCILTVKVGSQVVETLSGSQEDVSVRIEANGTVNVSFLCASPKAITAGAVCAVSDVRFDRDDAANRYGTFNGRALVNGIPGAATLTVSKTGKISGKIACADRNWTFSATGGWNDAGNFIVTLKSGRAKIEDVTFQLKMATGEVLAYLKDELEPIALFARNVWSDKPLSAEAAWAYKNCMGYLTAVLPPETELGDPLYGSGYCGLTVSKSGVVRAAGRLADGQSLSVSGTLVPGENACAQTFLFVNPSAYKGGWYFAAPAFMLRDFGAYGEKIVVTNAVLDSILDRADPWSSSATGATFARTPGFVGGWYDKTENLAAHYAGDLKVAKVDSVSDLKIGGKDYSALSWATDEDHPVSLSFNEAGSRLLATCGGDDRLFSVSFTRSTGIFTGSFRAVYDYTSGGKVRTVTKSSVYRGMLIPYAPASEAAAGRGYFLMPETDAGTGKTVNKSYEVEIGE